METEMILSFKPQFKDKILNGTKIHTIREDKNRRWKKGMLIHFATGVRTKNYKQFMQGECKFKQAIFINPETKTINLGLNGTMFQLPDKYNSLLAKNDGFDTEDDFWNWFNTPFSGMIIHWTDYVYK